MLNKFDLDGEYVAPFQNCRATQRRLGSKIEAKFHSFYCATAYATHGIAISRDHSFPRQILPNSVAHRGKFLEFLLISNT